MKYSEFRQREWYSYLSKYELPVETFWGIPFLSWENGVLQLVFYPHSIQFQDGRILVCVPECRICLNYPFKHMEEFVRYHGKKTEPVCSIDVEWLKGDGKIRVQELCKMFDDILESMAVSQEKAACEVGAYQKKMKELLDKLNLPDRYQETGL